MADDLQGKLYDAFDHDPLPAAEFVHWMAKQTALPKRLDVLDIGCGVGRMLPLFAGYGWNVVGLEPDADFLEQARANIAGLGKRVRLEKGHFGTLDAQGAYHLITMINDPFAYLLTVEARVEALKRLYTALHPGGVILIEIKNFLFKLLHHEPIQEEEKEVDGSRVVHISQHEVDVHHAQWIHHDEYLVEGQPRTIRKRHQVAIIPVPELIYFLKQQGFEDIQTYPNYDARAPAEITDRLVLISARKPS